MSSTGMSSTGTSGSEQSARSVVRPPTHTRPGRVFSPGIVHNGLLWASGATGSDPASGEIVPGGVAAQTTKALHNLGLVAAAAGTSLDAALRLTVYLIDIRSGLAPMNEAFAEVFPVDPPARSTIEVAGLARPGLLVEIDMVAAIDG